MLASRRKRFGERPLNLRLLMGNPEEERERERELNKKKEAKSIHRPHMAKVEPSVTLQE